MRLQGQKTFSVLFVCTGNICRSPTAEGVFRKIMRDDYPKQAVFHDSAGIQGYHIGESPDSRSVAFAKERGVVIDDLRARKVIKSDFERFQYIIAMDRGHLQALQAIQPENSIAAVQLLLDYHEKYKGQDVPDPYFGSSADFANTYALIEQGVQAFINQVIHS